MQNAAGAAAPTVRLFQDRTVRQLTYAEARRKSERGLVREAQTLASLRGEPTTNTRTLERIASIGVRDASDDVSVGAREAFNAKLAARHAFFAAETVAARSSLSAQLRDDDEPDDPT